MASVRVVAWGAGGAIADGDEAVVVDEGLEARLHPWCKAGWDTGCNAV
jgi:hypothetical protein